MGNVDAGLVFVLALVGYAAFCWLICHLVMGKFTLTQLRQIEEYEQKSWEKYGLMKPVHDIRLGLRALVSGNVPDED